MQKHLLMARDKAKDIFPMENLTFLIVYIQYTSMQKRLLMARCKLVTSFQKKMDFLILYIQYTSMQKLFVLARGKAEGIFPMENLTFLIVYI